MERLHGDGLCVILAVMEQFTNTSIPIRWAYFAITLFASLSRENDDPCTAFRENQVNHWEGWSISPESGSRDISITLLLD